MKTIKKHRAFLKDSLRKEIDFRRSDQYRGIAVPPLEMAAAPDLPRIPLPDINKVLTTVSQKTFAEITATRKSRRKYSDEPLTIEELTFLLWSTQGIRDPKNDAPHFRTVPSAGARHCLETYLLIHRVEKLPSGLYRFLPLTRELVFINSFGAESRPRLIKAVLGQKFVADSSVVFVWAAVPYRMEWRYLESAHRVILLDAGHVCQNLYLAAESLDAGTCAIAAYDQEAMDTLIGVDGEDQFTIYLAPVGKY